jgi:predicted RNase H-like HicB family nuclease
MTVEGQTMELTANIHREDGSYWADVSELPGCFASGDNLDELFTSLREGIQLYVESDGRSNDYGSLGARLQIKVAVLSDAAPA